MRLSIVVAFLITCVAASVVAGGPAQLVGSVEAVYHEDLVTFQVNHADAVSMSIRVYDLETDALIYDSGPREGTLVSWPAGYDVTGSFRYVVTAWNEQGEVVVSQAAVTKNLTPISAISFDTIPGNTKLLGPNEVIVESDLQVGATPGVLIDQAWSTYGGAIKWYEEGGVTTHSYIEPDAGGQGGYLYVDGTGASGGYINAQGMGVGDLPQFYINGTSDFGVYSGNTGDASIVMPASSVSAAEMGNEPGVASSYLSSSLTITGTHNVLARTITPPSSGFLVMSASADATIAHITGNSSWVRCSISTNSLTLDADSDMNAGVSTNAPTGSYWQNLSMDRVVSTTGATDTWYVVCDGTTGGSIYMYERHFNILFVPTSYGVVTEGPTDLDGDQELVEGYIPLDDHPISETDIEAERVESINANLARIQAELAAIQAQADALAAEADNNQP